MKRCDRSPRLVPHLNRAQRQLTAIVLAALAFVLLAGRDAEATHFRYATVSTRPILNAVGQPTGQVEFKIRSAWRRGFFNTGTFTCPSLPPPLPPLPVVGCIFQPESFNFNDGTPAQLLSMTVTSFSSAEDFIIGEATVLHTYSGAGPFTAFGADSQRVTNLNNGSNASWRYEVPVRPLSTNNSPVSALPPIVTVQQGTSAQFFVPASDLERDNLTFKIAPASQTGSGTAAVPGLTINSTTGLVTWNNLTSGLSGGPLNTTNFWFTQIIIEDRDSLGNVKSSIPIDVLLRITTQKSDPPLTQIDGSNAPKSFNVAPGNQVSFTVLGSDPDGANLITVGASGMPPAATTTPPLPINDVSPQSTLFSWTPTIADIGSRTISFFTSDVTGILTLNSVNIFVACTFSLAPSAQEILGAPSNGTVSLTTQAGCPWTASADVPWLHPTPNGSGSGSVSYSSDTNLTRFPRIGRLTVGAASVQITQQPAVSATNTGAATKPVISANGRFLAFATDGAVQLSPGVSDPNGQSNIFVFDRVKNTNVRVSVSTAGVAADGPSGNPRISGDGRFVVFESDATNLILPDALKGDNNRRTDIYLRDRDTDGNGLFDELDGVTTSRVSVSSFGAEGNGNSVSPWISADAQVVAFASDASTLVFNDTNGQRDVFVTTFEVQKFGNVKFTTTRASVAGTSQQAIGGGSDHPSLTSDGIVVAFDSDATNLVGGDTNLKRDVFVRNRSLSSTLRVSLTAAGGQTDDNSFSPVITDGGEVAFSTNAALVPGDTNQASDVYSRLLSGGTAVRESVDNDGLQAAGASFGAAISADGRYLAFTSAAANLSILDTNNAEDVFVRDRQAVPPFVRLASPPNPDGIRRRSFDASLSRDGETIAYATEPVPVALTDGGVVAAAGGTTSNAVIQTTPPSVTGLSPTHGPVGTDIQISGTSLLGAIVRVDGALVPTVGVSATAVNFKAPNHAAPAVVNVSIEVGAISVVKQFTYDAVDTCTLQVPPSEVSLNEANKAAVAIASGCEWAASSTVGWLTVDEPSSFNGNGQLSVTAEANTAPAERVGEVLVNGTPLRFRQRGQVNGCNLGVTVTDNRPIIESAGGPADKGMTIAIERGCEWRVETTTTWLRGGTFRGSGPVQYTVDRNTDQSDRTGDVTVVGANNATITVTQKGEPLPSCQYTPESLDLTVAKDGETRGILVSTAEPCQWNASPLSDWITINGTNTLFGTNRATFTAIRNPANGNREGGLLIAGQRVTVRQPGQAAGLPFGNIDTPKPNTTDLSGSIAITGWALDDQDVTAVEIYREPVPGEKSAKCFPNDPSGPNCVFIGKAVFIKGSRPDVQQLFPALPNSDRAGWGYLLLTNFLPNQGNGTFTLHVFAYDGQDIENPGNLVELDPKSIQITVANSTSKKPFGNIDTPEQGGTATGAAYANFGWVLSPGPALAFPPNGTVSVVIDGEALGTQPVGWESRPDLTSLFPAALFPGVANALGVATIDTTALSNGVHSIAWVVTDNTGADAGVGSRFFRVENATGPITASAMMMAPSSQQIGELPVSAVGVRLTRGLNEDLTTVVRADRSGVRHVVIRALDVFRLAFGDGTAAGLDGYAAHGDRLEPLPVGSTLDSAVGTFSWQLGPGFGGVYDLVFVRSTSGRQERIPVRIVVEPGADASWKPLRIDAPAAGADLSRPFTIAGAAMTGAARALQHVTVYAYPADGSAPRTIGQASLPAAGPDLHAPFGGQFALTPFSIDVEALPAGSYDLVVVARSRIASDLDASIRVRGITVR